MSFNERLWRNITKDQFEELCKLLLKRMNPDIKSIDGKGGDEGVDSFIGMFEGEIIIYQMKFFPERLNQNQKDQIKESLEQAINNHDVKIWNLVIPLDSSRSERRWFQDLGKQNPNIELKWFGHTELESLLYKNTDLLQEYFKIDPYKYTPMPKKTEFIINKLIKELKRKTLIEDIPENEINTTIRSNDSWKIDDKYFYLCILDTSFEEQILVSISEHLKVNDYIVIYAEDRALNVFNGKFRFLPLSNNLKERELKTHILNYKEFIKEERKWI